VARRADQDETANLPPDDPLVGQALGDFVLERLIFSGPMSCVYKGRQRSRGRAVAIKVLPPDLARDASYVARFSREALAAAAVKHPNIIEVFAVSHDRGHHFIAMEFVEGESLAAAIEREGRLAPGRALAIMKQVAAAVAAAHAQRVVHRDIKPGNILLSADGHVKVADFGLAKRQGLDASVTVAGTRLGTPFYMAAEVADGKRADAASDLYSIGATFYHVLAGRPPFEGETHSVVIHRHVNAEVPSLAELAPDVPPALRAIIHRLLAKRPADRYASAEELLAALNHVEQPPSAAAPPAAVALPGTPQPNTQLPTPLLAAGARWQVYTGWPFDAAQARRRQEETAAALGVPVEQEIELGNGARMRFALIPAGEFLMGTPPPTNPPQPDRPSGGEAEHYRDEFPQHRVKLTAPFWLGKFPATQAEWEAVMGDKPSHFAGRPQNPVEQVSWERSQDFVRKLAASLGRAVRLPSEAEWEYACRAGAATEFCFGDDPGGLGAYTWFADNAGGATHPVGEKQPNAWGLHDAHGNVWEWCEDVWHPGYQGAPDDGSAWLTGGERSLRVLRGGAWDFYPWVCRSALRLWLNPWSAWINTGVRVCLEDF